MKLNDEIDRAIEEALNEKEKAIEMEQWLQSFRARVLEVLGHPALRN